MNVFLQSWGEMMVNKYYPGDHASKTVLLKTLLLLVKSLPLSQHFPYLTLFKLIMFPVGSRFQVKSLIINLLPQEADCTIQPGYLIQAILLMMWKFLSR